MPWPGGEPGQATRHCRCDPRRGEDSYMAGGILKVSCHGELSTFSQSFMQLLECVLLKTTPKETLRNGRPQSCVSAGRDLQCHFIHKISFSPFNPTSSIQGNVSFQRIRLSSVCAGVRRCLESMRFPQAHVLWRVQTGSRSWVKLRR